MSRELSLYEAMGGTYRSVAGILYPNIGMDDVDTKSDMASVVTTADIGKYGHLWIPMALLWFATRAALL